MWKLTSTTLLLVLLVCGVTNVAAQKNRVCLAQIADYGAGTAFTFCTQAVYLALRLNSNAAITYVSTTMTSAAVEASIRTFAGYKSSNSHVDFYLGVDTLPGDYGWITVPNNRATAISAIIAQLRTYPNIIGVYIDIVNVIPARGSQYRMFIQELQAATSSAGFKLAIALPWDSTTYVQNYLPTPGATIPPTEFYLVKTYEDMYVDQTTRTHPISPLFALASPFNTETKTIYNNVFRWVLNGVPTSKLALGLPMYGLRFTAAGATQLGATATNVATDTYCNALKFGVANTPGTAQAGEGFAYSTTEMMVYNTFESITEKLSFSTATNLFGVGLFSMDQAGSKNVELLRYITSVLAPVPPTGVVYPAAEPATCQVPITFPVPPTTSTSTPTSTSTSTPTSTSTSTPTSTSTSTPTSTSTSTPTSTSTSTPTSTSTSTPTSTSTSTPTSTSTSTPTSTSTSTPTSTSTSTPTSTSTSTPTSTSTSTPTSTSTSTPTSTSTSTPTSTSTSTPTSTSTSTPTSTSTSTPTSTSTSTPTSTSTSTPTSTSTSTPTSTSTSTPTSTSTSTPSSTSTSTPTSTSTSTPTSTSTSTPTSTSTSTPTSTSTSTPTSTSTASGPTTTVAPPLVCGIPARPEYGNLLSEYCAGVQNVTAYIALGPTCGTVL
ncbi:serine-rich adhesin for platelets-like [Anopheles albimanus]|uniref:serine-rich adhesin for platelets-like n=1 Tax=Anopheles albimanus TaxID=7167 RepID=UPI0016420235|nr:serine-rich adhesin for platelets-like [Anopheles albimanus]